MTTPSERVRHLAAAAQSRGDATGWLDEVYAGAGGDPGQVPWADQRPNPNLVEWLDRAAAAGRAHGGRALVVGCGLGDDAEELSRRGYDVTAFDVAPSAIEWCRSRHGDSRCTYLVADLLQPPADWAQAFDLVVEAYTVQVLRGEARREALLTLPAFVAPGGTLLLIARGRDDDDPEGDFPWPLTKRELAPLVEVGLDSVALEDYPDPVDPAIRRFRAEFTRPT